MLKGEAKSREAGTASSSSSHVSERSVRFLRSLKDGGGDFWAPITLGLYLWRDQAGLTRGAGKSKVVLAVSQPFQTVGSHI